MCAKVLRLDHHEVKLARRHPFLVGKKPIGRGVFSAVFEGTRKNTVLKMTVDYLNHSMLNDWACGVTHRHFPRAVKDHGQIGETRVGNSRFPILLFEMERLQKLKRGSEVARLAKTIEGVSERSQYESYASRRSAKGRCEFADHEAITKMARNVTLPKSIRNALNQLSDFCRNMPGGSLDMHMANFMQRKNGELVIIDPLVNNAIIDATSWR